MERGQWADLASMPRLNPYSFSKEHPMIFDDFTQNIFIYVPKMNEGLRSLEQHKSV